MNLNYYMITLKAIIANSQRFNKYSYVLNNPLKYTDPDGNSGVSVSGTNAILSPGSSDFDPELNMLAQGQGMHHAQFNSEESEFTDETGKFLLTTITWTQGHNANIRYFDDDKLGRGYYETTESETKAVINSGSETFTTTPGAGNPDGNNRGLNLTPGGKLFPTQTTGSGSNSFPGISIYQPSFMHGGITIPPIGIFVEQGKWLGLRQHEYGHYLQFRSIGAFKYYKEIAFPSIYNAAENELEHWLFGGNYLSVYHRFYSSETQANDLSKNYFPSNTPISTDPYWVGMKETKYSGFNWHQRLAVYYLAMSYFELTCPICPLIIRINSK